MVARPQTDSVSSRALRRIRGWQAGHVFVPQDLADLGSRAAVDTALHRLVRLGAIRRIGRGLYDCPRMHPRLGPLAPSPDDIAAAIARTTGETLVSSGATAANLLGLSTQVPARPVFLTDGATRDQAVGRLRLRFKHAAPRRLAGGDSTPGLVLRALRYLGKDGIDDAAVERLDLALSAKDRRGLLRLRQHAPAWMHSIIDRIARGGEDSPAASNQDSEQNRVDIN